MLQIYLPIAEMSVNILLLIGLGAITGMLAGMFGVGGGFLMTPLLIFIGVPPAVAVATSANQIVASSASGFRSHWRRKMVDFKMGNLLLVGGIIGSVVGVRVFKWLQDLGQIDLVISVSYVGFLSIIGGLMAIESFRAIRKKKSDEPTAASSVHEKRNWLDRLPLKMRFPKSKLYISALIPLGLSFMIGILVSILGIGGGFFMVPAMIYLLRMPTSVVIGTSLYQTIFITAAVTMLHAVSTYTVDVLLALMLLIGGVIGAQIGSRFSGKLPAEKLRALLAIIVLSVAVKLAYGLFVTPPDIYSVSMVEASND